MSIDRNGQDPDGYQGVNPVNRPKTVIAQRAPGTLDRRYNIGTPWINRTAGSVYFLTTVTNGAANWAISTPGASDVDTLTGDSGGALSPTAGNMNILGGTNMAVAGSGSTLTLNVDAASSFATSVTAPAIVGSTSVTAPLYTAGAGVDLDLTAPAGQDCVLKLGDASGANYFVIEDVAGTDQLNVDSDGQLNLLTGNLVQSRSDSAAEVLLQVTNSDNTSAASDAFFEAAVGGTSSGNPGIRFQISGGQNYAMGIDNADSDKLVICADNDLGTDVLMKMDETTKDVEVAQGNLVIGAVAKQLQMNGGAVTDFIGQVTLVSGTATVANTNIAANDRIFLSRADENSSSALGMLTVTAQTASTSWVVTALDPSDGSTTITGDVSIVNYFIVRQN